LNRLKTGRFPIFFKDFKIGVKIIDSERLIMIIKIIKRMFRRCFAPIEFINYLDGWLCDYKILNSIDGKDRDPQDVLRFCVKEYYGFDIYEEKNDI